MEKSLIPDYFISQAVNQLPEIYSRINRLDPRFHDLGCLLSHTYFSRVWITQEIVFSNHVHMRCDGCWLDWETFATAISSSKTPKYMRIMGRETLYQFEKDSCALYRIVTLSNCRNAERHFRSTNKGRKSLSFLCSHLRFSEATDPRDMIFGHLGLSKEAEDHDFVPDYSWTL